MARSRGCGGSAVALQVRGCSMRVRMTTTASCSSPPGAHLPLEQASQLAAHSIRTHETLTDQGHFKLSETCRHAQRAPTCTGSVSKEILRLHESWWTNGALECLHHREELPPQPLMVFSCMVGTGRMRIEALHDDTLAFRTRGAWPHILLRRSQ